MQTYKIKFKLGYKEGIHKTAALLQKRKINVNAQEAEFASQ
jgi:hypothetical protein